MPPVPDQTVPYHIPVLLEPTLDALHIKPDGTYVDVTFGGGGHSAAIAERLGPQGKLISFDQDPDAQANSHRIKHPNFTLVAANFRHLFRFLRLHNGGQLVDGVLADLGVSSHQFDTPERGFSIRFDAELDMRMDPAIDRTAANILQNYNEKQLHQIFGQYGEVKNARTLARTVVQQRGSQPLQTTEQLKTAIASCLPFRKEHKYLAQVFQALRIEVNQEMEALKEMLLQTAKVIKPGGRLVVMSYHSLEDRLVKNYMAMGKFSGQPEKNFYGHLIAPFKPEPRKPILASEEEIQQNSRARSVRLRAAVRAEDPVSNKR